MDFSKYRNPDDAARAFGTGHRDGGRRRSIRPEGGSEMATGRSVLKQKR